MFEELKGLSKMVCARSPNYSVSFPYLGTSLV